MFGYDEFTRNSYLERCGGPMILRPILAVSAFLFVWASTASAHFLELLPSADVLPEGGEVTLDIVFTHPMERGPVMELARPRRLAVLAGSAVTDISSALTEVKTDGTTRWNARHALKEPGAAVFYVEPEPYWEPAEGKFIVHYAKVVVDSHASGEGWDALAGLPVEIEPLVRPTGLWAGNLFRGIVRRDGEPVPFATIEVEYVNDGAVKPPNDAFITQVIKADASGTFAYAMPRAGWWGFAALVEAEKQMTSPHGTQVPVELGALMWVQATGMETAPSGTGPK